MAKPKAKRGKRADQGPAPQPYSQDLSLADECRRLAFIPFPQPARIGDVASVDFRSGPVLLQLVGFFTLAAGLMASPDAGSKPHPKPSAPTTQAPTSSVPRPGTVINPMSLPDAKAKPKPPARNIPARPRLPAVSSGRPVGR